MKTLFLADSASIHTKKWVDYFIQKGDEVYLLSFSSVNITDCKNNYLYIKTGKINPSGGNFHYLLGMRQVAEAIKRINPDIISAHYLTSYGLFGALLKGSRKLVQTVHGSDLLLTPEKGRLYRWLATFSLSRADLIIAVAEHMTNRIKQLIKNKKIITIQYGVQIVYNQFDAARPIDFISTRALNSNARVELIIEAFNSLKVENIKLHIAGEGKERSRLMAKYFLCPNIKWLGELNNQELVSLLRKAKIYLAMTKSDGASLSLLEAMATGCFPIVSNIPANQEWIENGVNGLLVSDSKDLAAAMQTALGDDKLRLNAQRLNRDSINERGDYQKNMEYIYQNHLKLLSQEKFKGGAF